MEFNFKINELSDTQKASLMVAGKVAYRCSWVLFISYLLASTINTGVLFVLMYGANSKAPRTTFGNSNLGIRRDVNYLDVRRAVLDRLLFNKDGELPDEADPSEEEEKGSSTTDIASQPCSKTSLPIDLVGTIYLGENGNSLATVQEKGYTQADVYRSGDEIIGYEQAKVYKVEQKRLILNNGGRKECLELKDPEKPASDMGYAYDPAKNSGDTPPAGGDCGNIVLTESYVKKELGPDYQEILKKGRLIPHERGWKVIGINKNSLFGKVCLNNGDVLTQINGINLQEPDKGFTFYKMFQDERDIRISLLRNGTNPMTINVQVK